MSENEFLPGSIRERIVDLKRKTNANNKTIAEKTGVSESLLSRIESGKQQTVSDDAVLKLSSFFGVSTDFLLGRTNVPDKKNYTIEELGLSAQAARNLYTGSVDVNVVNRLLAEPEFATLTLMIADYFDDTYATAHATQNQIHQCTAELFSRIAREDSQRRQKATSLSKQARAQCTPLYKTELAQMATQFEKTLKAIKKELPDKASEAKTMTKQAFDHMVEELTKNGSAVDILSVKPEQIAESLCAYASVMDGVTDEMKENFYNAVLPLFHAGGSKVG
jgi:transcriptional regulator with XRE-family HTH domain